MQKLEMLIKTVDAHYDSLHKIQCYYLSCSLLNIARGTCNMMIVSDDSDFLHDAEEHGGYDNGYAVLVW